MGGRGLRADGGPVGLAAGRASDRHGAARVCVGSGHEGVLMVEAATFARAAGAAAWAVEMRLELKATVMRSWALVRMVATAGSSAACRCTASAPHRAPLRAGVVVVGRAGPLRRGAGGRPRQGSASTAGRRGFR